MRQFFLSALFVVGIVVHVSFAGIGGATVWTVKVTAMSSDPSPDRHVCEIPVVGDDGVVIVKLYERIWEIVPQSAGSPIVRRVPLEGLPWARVGGRTIVLRDGIPHRGLQWIGAGGKVISIPSFNGEFAVAENGEIFSTIILDEIIHLTKWSTNGEILFRKALGRFYADGRNGPFVASGLVMGPEGTLFIAMSGGTSPSKMFAFKSDGEQLWSTNLGNELRAPLPFLPTSSGGVWTLDYQGGATRLTVDGFADARLPGKPWVSHGLYLSPTDEAMSGDFVDLDGLPRCALADGGSAYSFGEFYGHDQATRPSIIRLSSIGTQLWAKWVVPPYRPPIASRIGNGLAYFSAWIQKAENLFECHLSAIDLGAPPADSSCPFTGTIWPDGSHRARRRSHAPPTVTMIAKPRHSGAVIEFGVEDNLRYSVETADKADGPWRSVGTVTGAGYGARFTDPTSVGDPMRLYRVRRSP